MKEIKFSTANHPDQWWADDYGGVIKFASAVDAKAAERLFNALAQRTEAVAPIITDLGIVKKHPDCEDRCMLREHKGYHTCSQTGLCNFALAVETPRMDAAAGRAHATRKQG